jgi:large subunit ribosomal protein L3
MSNSSQSNLGLIAKKRGMTQVFNDDGAVTPVTILEVFPLTVTQIKNDDNDGYSAVQVAYQPAKAKHLNKPQQGLFNKVGVELHRHLQEFRLDTEASAQYSVGQAIDLEAIFQPGDAVNVTGTSIGKGFQGNTRAHGHHRGPMSHGSKSHRLPGSIGAGTTPGRVFKGLKMAKNLGNERVTVKNLNVVNWVTAQDEATQESVQLILISGAIPGKKGSVVTIKPFKRVGK